MVYERKSNIELLRIIAMLMIFLLHANYLSLGAPTKDDSIVMPLVSFWRILAEQICIVGVNVFVLISGWFGIKPSNKGLLSLLFQIVFWAVTIMLIAVAANLEIPIKSSVKVLYLGAGYWFIVSYIILYALSPILNLFVQHSTKQQFLTLLAGYFLLEFAYGWIFGFGGYLRGYSTLSFIGLYLLARYINLHARWDKHKSSTYFLLYALFTILPAVISFFGRRFELPSLSPIAYSSPFVIAASVSLLLAFVQMRVQSRCINWIACSVLSVYLVHCHPIILPLVIQTMRTLSTKLSVVGYTGAVTIISIIFLLLCVVVDKVRIVGWKALCSLFVDKLLKRIEATFGELFVE